MSKNEITFNPKFFDNISEASGFVSLSGVKLSVAVNKAGNKLQGVITIPEDFVFIINGEAVKNKYIVCVYGMGGLHVRIDENIKKAISILNDEKITYLNKFVPNDAGANFHPDKVSQKEWAKILAESIKEIILI